MKNMLLNVHVLLIKYNEIKKIKKIQKKYCKKIKVILKSI